MGEDAETVYDTTSGETRTRLKRVANILQAYSIQYVIVRADPETAVDVFVRLNNGGKKLTKQDIKVAELSRNGSNDAVVRRLKETMKLLQSSAFQRVTLNHLFVTLEGAAGRDVLELNARELDNAMKRVSKGIAAAQKLLKANLAVSNMAVLQSGALLVPLFVALGSAEKLNAELSHGLLRWLAWAALRERYQSGANTALAADAAAAADSSPVAALLKNLSITKTSKARGDDFDGYLQNRSKLFASYIALHQRGLHGLDGVRMQHGVDYEVHHIYPKARLRNTEAEAERHCIANLTFITKQENRDLSDADPAIYLPKVGLSVRKSHCMPELGSYEGKTVGVFWKKRKEQLAVAFNEFVSP